ncbi:MAG: hypothetical protein JSW00_01885 [Thermoplasmata archaeon]|nr:MAG: hypothetical protein JSW00_01885 [Thermoplasmata archaeon]
MKKVMALISLLILVFLSTSGCIDIYLLRDWLVPDRDTGIKMMEEEIIVANYTFESNVNFLSFNFDDIIDHHEENASVTIKEGAEGLLFEIEVNMRSFEEIWEQINDTIGNYTDLGENVADAIETLIEYFSQRYLEITISKPDGTQWYQNYTRQSMEDSIRIGTPETGGWMVDVVGDGVGIDASNIVQGLKIVDSFMITAVIRRPK